MRLLPALTSEIALPSPSHFSFMPGFPLFTAPRSPFSIGEGIALSISLTFILTVCMLYDTFGKRNAFPAWGRWSRRDRIEIIPVCMMHEKRKVRLSPALTSEKRTFPLPHFSFIPGFPLSTAPRSPFSIRRRLCISLSVALIQIPYAIG